MARKKKHEEHGNHEAWAIPYADLMTLLLAFLMSMSARTVCVIAMPILTHIPTLMNMGAERR